MLKGFFKEEWPFLILLLIPLVAAIIIYPYMPEQVPTHWNIKGEIDQYSSREFGTFFLPVLNIGLYVLFFITPYIDPKKRNYHKFYSSFKFLRFTIHIFFILIFSLITIAALGYSVDIGLWVSAAVALLFIFLGNVLSRVRHNYFIGFRFPWTLANEEVWRKTHLLGSKLMVAGGLLALGGVFLAENNLRFMIVLAGLLLPSLVTFIYSYLLYTKLNNDSPQER
ncbi:MAG: SdpI family protein [Peptococcaceae bacterium]